MPACRRRLMRRPRRHDLAVLGDVVQEALAHVASVIVAAWACSAAWALA